MDILRKIAKIGFFKKAYFCFLSRLGFFSSLGFFEVIKVRLPNFVEKR